MCINFYGVNFLIVKLTAPIYTGAKLLEMQVVASNADKLGVIRSQTRIHYNLCYYQHAAILDKTVPCKN